MSINIGEKVILFGIYSIYYSVLRISLYILCMILLPGLQAVKAQKNEFITTSRHLGQENGLVSKFIYCGTTDSKGFVWFGTSNGLQRYDGERMKLFSKEKNGLQGNNVVRIEEGPAGMLWILYGVTGSDRQSSGKLDLMDINTNRVVSLQQKYGAQLPFEANKIVTICSNEKKEIVIVTKNNNGSSDLFLCPDNQTIKKIASGIPIYHDYPHHLVFRENTILFYAKNQTGLLTLDGKSRMIAPDLKGADNFFPLGIDAEGRLFASTSSVNKQGKIFAPPLVTEIMKDGKTKPIENQLFTKDHYANYEEIFYNATFEARSGNIVISQIKMGIFLFSGGEFVQLADTLELRKYRDLTVYDYFTMPGERHWLCTSEGVFEFNTGRNFFTSILSDDDITLPRTLDHQVRSIYADTTGNVYVASWDGFFRLRTNETGKAEYKKLLPNNIPTFDGFYFDKTHFWIASGDSQIIRYDPVLEKTEKFRADSLRIWSGITTKQGSLLIGAVKGFGKLDGNCFSRIGSCGTNLFPLPWVYQFFYSRDGKLWAVTNNGLYHIGENDCIKSHYHSGGAGDYFLPFDDLHQVYEDRDGVFWMATNGGGMVKWDRAAKTFEQLTIADGLSSNVLYAILEDDYGSLWISSEYGLMHFNKENKAVFTYTKEDGITDNEYNRISYFKAANGKMYFGGLNGVTVFSPADFRKDSLAINYPLEIISFSQFDGRQDKLLDKTEELLAAHSITMNPGDKFFALDFQLLDFNKGSHRYAYLIEGIDEEWNYIESNSIRISGLPSGDYTLRIKGQNAEGQWSKNELKFTLQVVSPIYVRWWFISLLALSLMGFVYLFFRVRTREIKKSKRALEKTVQERTKQLNVSLAEKEMLIREIHHRVNNNLQVISGLFELEERNSTDERLTLRIAEGRNRLRSIALIHQNLYKNKNVAAIQINHFLQGLFGQVKDVFKRDGMPVEIISNVPEIELDIETAVPLGLILNELLTNSFKYAFKEDGDGKIMINMGVLEPGKYQLIFRDNGPGLPPGFDPAKAQTMGMLLIFDLIRQIGGNVTYSFYEGSTFTLVFTNNQFRKNTD